MLYFLQAGGKEAKSHTLTVPTVNAHDAKMMKQSTNDDGTSVRILIFSSVKMSHWVMRMQIETINYDGTV